MARRGSPVAMQASASALRCEASPSRAVPRSRASAKLRSAGSSDSDDPACARPA
jgi:hypothetical protein